MQVAIYARVSSERQDVDLSISAQLKAMREHASVNGYQLVKEYVDEAESGRTSQRPVFQQMIRDARRVPSPFEAILVWKLSRFARNREDSIVYKTLLRKNGVRLISITEPFEDSPTGKLLEAIVESLDEFYSANLGQEIVRGMRESASRGFYVEPTVPYGYRRVKVKDGKKERAKLEADSDTAPVVRRIFSQFLHAQGLKEVVQGLNRDGIASPRGVGWSKTAVYNMLMNEAYTGTLVWGRNHEVPVRVENAWGALVDRETFDQAQALLKERGFKMSHPRRTASHFLLSGLVRCKACGKALIGQDAKSGRFSYYVCGTLIRKGAGTCDARYLPKERFEEAVLRKLKEDVLTEEHLRELVKLMAEEMDGDSTVWRDQMDTVEKELADVQRRLDRLYDALETGQLVLEDLAPRIQGLRHRREQLEAAREEVRDHMGNRKRDLMDLETVTAYAEDLRQVLNEGSLSEQRSFIKSFVQEISVEKEQAVIRYTLPLPPGNVTPEPTGVLSIVNDGGPNGIRTSRVAKRESLRLMGQNNRPHGRGRTAMMNLSQALQNTLANLAGTFRRVEEDLRVSDRQRHHQELLPNWREGMGQRHPGGSPR